MSFKKNAELDNYISYLNKVLIKSEDDLLKNVYLGQSGFPAVIKLGSPRSGGTLLTQWAQSTTAFQLPTNFMSRFYGAPGIGSLIYKMMIDPKYDYKGELNFSEYIKENYKSDIGKTIGFYSPHEFWYFWRENLFLPDIPTSLEEFSLKSDFEKFSKSLELMQTIFGKPLFLKGHLVNFYLKAFSEKVKNVVFLHQYRDPIATISSLLEARKKWTGSYDVWFSHKPRSYNEIKNLDPIYQVAGQIYFIEKEVFSMRENLKDRYFSFSYEELCMRPSGLAHELIKFIEQFSNKEIALDYKGPQSFTLSNKSIDISLKNKIRKAWDYFEKRYGALELLDTHYK